MEALKERVLESLEDTQPWARVPTSIEGIFLVKTPESGSKPTILVEINPINERGVPIKRRGLFIRQSNELSEFIRVINIEDVKKLVDTVDTLNTGKGKEEQGVLKI